MLILGILFTGFVGACMGYISMLIGWNLKTIQFWLVTIPFVILLGHITGRYLAYIGG